MINNLIQFPIWRNDDKSIVSLNKLQKDTILKFKTKIKNGEYKLVPNPCLCGNTNEFIDIVVAEKDRYGIPCCNVLCKKCGIIRLKERLDDYSTSEFYRNEYRDIYVHKFKEVKFFIILYERILKFAILILFLK